VNNAYGLKESEEVLTVAKRLKGLLEADDLTVCMTRGGGYPDNATLSNRDRYTYANTTGANLLVSIHMNGSSDSTVDYTTTLYGKWQKDKALAYAIFGKLQANPPYGLVTLPAAKPDDPDNLLNGKQPYSYASGVLLKSNMPATIAETVFITNPYEAAWLADPSEERQQQIAQKLEEGILTYLQTH
jgi:N-acetylmuramoyl-L-alanine amidase